MTDADFMAIPEFLRRERADEARPVRRTKRTAKIKVPKFKVELPKMWRGAKTAFVAAYPPAYPLHFPTGTRSVLYIEGRNTVRVREVVLTGNRRAATAKLTKRDFERSVK